ncbi:MAG: phosphate ABC transporter permease PstA [Caldilineae bacterium]|nr:MAG: phosphate ABC transporter permease PstA [Caldilineae bacterium]
MRDRVSQVPGYPDEKQFQGFIRRRRRRGAMWRTLFLIATSVGIVVLSALLLNILDDSFGYVAVKNEIEPAALLATYAPKRLPMERGGADYQILRELSRDVQVQILRDHLSQGLIRRLESEQPLDQRSQEELGDLIIERVVEPHFLASWSLFDSVFHRARIKAEVAEMDGASLRFYSWLNPKFVVSPQSSHPEFAGIRTAILGSLWVVAITILFSLPVGVAAAIYLEEYGQKGRLNDLIETNINNLAGVPSIIYGLLGLAIFVRALQPLTGGSLFGIGDATTNNGRTIISAGLTLGLLILPIIIINAREAIRAVPQGIRQASYGLGATRWQTVWHHVLPNAMPGILTGSILAISRAFGETAPLVVIGASAFIIRDPDGPFSKFTTMTIQIYQWTARPQAEFRHLAAAGIIVLLALLLGLNATAIWLRNRYQRSY